MEQFFCNVNAYCIPSSFLKNGWIWYPGTIGMYYIARPLLVIGGQSREKGRDLTQSYDKSLYTHRKIQKATWQHKNATKNLITQRLRTDLGFNQDLFSYSFNSDKGLPIVKTAAILYKILSLFVVIVRWNVSNLLDNSMYTIISS